MEKHIRESNLIEGIDDVIQDRQAMVAWRWLEGQRALNSTVVKRVHKILTFTQKDLAPEHKGIFRPIQVYVGTHVPPKPEDVKKEMSRWFKGYEGWGPHKAHIRFETIHPFVDGNGRAGFTDGGPHAVRRSSISAALDNGMPLANAAKWAGHSDPKITLKHYYKPNTQIMQEQHAMAMEKALALAGA